MITNEMLTKYGVINDYNDAREMCEMGKAKFSLLSSRQVLESIVKQLAKKCSLDTDNKDLLDIIDELNEVGFIANDEASTLHRIRILGNRGAHPGDMPLTIEEAEEAVDLLDKALACLDNSATNDAFVSSIAQDNNVPMINPDYFSTDRRYYGKWAYAMTREELLAIPEYVMLKDKADDGDIEAMLNIAVGFLPKVPNWDSETQMICMPPYKYRGKEFYAEKAFDTRYYYWICKAIDVAYNKINNGEDFPKKYMATTCLEAKKYSYYYQLDFGNTYVSGISEYYDNETKQYVYDKQYSSTKELPMILFNDEMDCFASATAIVATEVFDAVELGSKIISPIYREQSLNEILYLDYCQRYLVGFYENDPMTVYGFYAIDPDDTDKELTLDLLTKYSSLSTNNQNRYNEVLSRINSITSKKEEQNKVRNEYDKKAKKHIVIYKIVNILALLKLAVLIPLLIFENLDGGADALFVSFVFYVPSIISSIIILINSLRIRIGKKASIEFEYKRNLWIFLIGTFNMILGLPAIALRNQSEKEAIKAGYMDESQKTSALFTILYAFTIQFLSIGTIIDLFKCCSNNYFIFHSSKDMETDNKVHDVFNK